MATTPKHYVRKRIWLPLAQKRFDILGRPLTYFALTTPDLFDIRTLANAGLIETNERGYPGIGFCEKDDKTYTDISRALKWCKIQHKGTFEDFVVKAPEFRTDFDFDIVNLDFTWVPFPDEKSPLDGTWGAIEALIDAQFNNARSFDLLLTFRGSRTGTSENSLNQVTDLLSANLGAARGNTIFNSRVGHENPMQLLDENYVEFLLLGLPKLLIGKALNVGYELSEYRSIKYQRQGDAEDYAIVKFLFSLEIPSPSQLKFAQVPKLVDDYDAAVDLIFGLSPIDVDQILAENIGIVAAVESDLAAITTD